MRTKIIVACSLIALAYGTAALAQPAPSENRVEEMIVTAQKRSENIQSVPIVVNAASGETLAAARVSDTRQLQQIAPALQFTSDSGFASVFLRGIGTSISQPGTEPSVATFIDGIYVAAQQGVVTNLLGVDRVEVLSGPQGTLYGRNASGGAINIYTLTPTDTLEAAASLTIGNYGRREFEAHLSGGVTDKLAIGAYFNLFTAHTYLKFRPNTPLGQSKVDQGWAGRVKAVWEPADFLKFTGTVEHNYRETVSGALRNIQPNGLGVTLGGNPIIEKYVISSDVPQQVRPRTTSVTLREEADLGFADLVGITGFRKFKSVVEYTNLDGVDIPLVHVGSPMSSEQWSQELQVLSKPDQPLKWIAGLYYFTEKSGFLPLYVRSQILFAPAPFTSLDSFGPVKTNSYAAFAQVTAPLSFLAEGLRLTVGGRYTRDEKEKQVSRQEFRNDAGVQVFPAVSFPSASETWSKFTPKITLEYEMDAALFYVTYSEGFKSGQYNSSQPSDATPVNPEKLTDYEAGIKSELFDNRLRLNLAGYYYDFKNLQVQVLDPQDGVSAVLRNAATAKAHGIEMTAVAAVTPNFTLSLNAAWEKSKYSKFDNAPFYILSPLGNAQILGFSAAGNDLLRAPEFSGTLGGQYKIPLGNGGEIDLTASAYYNDGFSWDPAGQVKQESYTLVNASIGWTSSNGHLTARLWATNLTDKYTQGSAAVSTFGTYVSDNPPRMFGVTLSAKI